MCTSLCKVVYTFMSAVKSLLYFEAFNILAVNESSRIAVCSTCFFPPHFQAMVFLQDCLARNVHDEVRLPTKCISLESEIMSVFQIINKTNLNGDSIRSKKLNCSIKRLLSCHSGRYSLKAKRCNSLRRNFYLHCFLARCFCQSPSLA